MSVHIFNHSDIYLGLQEGFVLLLLWGNQQGTTTRLKNIQEFGDTLTRNRKRNSGTWNLPPKFTLLDERVQFLDLTCIRGTEGGRQGRIGVKVSSDVARLCQHYQKARNSLEERKRLGL